MSDISTAVTPEVGASTPAPLPPQIPALSSIISIAPADTPKPGYLTTEFYVTVLIALAPVIRIITNQDITGSIQIWATVSAGIAAAVYTIGRCFVKHTTIKTAVKTPDPIV